jgi:hypothetical protein
LALAEYRVKPARRGRLASRAYQESKGCLVRSERKDPRAAKAKPGRQAPRDLRDRKGPMAPRDRQDSAGLPDVKAQEGRMVHRESRANLD